MNLVTHRALACCLLFAAGSLTAAPRVWDGGKLDGRVSDPVNWDGDTTIPVSGTDELRAGANTIGGVPAIQFDTGEFRTPSFEFLASALAPYTVTYSSVDDSLTLTGSGVALLNSSPVRQTFSLITTTVGATTQTWDGGTQGLVMANINLGADHTLTFGGTGTSSTMRNEIVGGISGTGTSGLTKAGSGTLFLNNPGIASDYTGPTIVLDGVLQLGRANQIPDNSKLVLSGGTFDTGGFSETAGVLSLTGSVTIDFGASDSVSLFFSDSRLELWTTGMVNIINFTPGSDFLRFGSSAGALTSTQLGKISFNGSGASINSGGFVQPVPEPGASSLFLVAALLFAVRRRGHGAHPSA